MAEVTEAKKEALKELYGEDSDSDEEKAVLKKTESNVLGKGDAMKTAVVTKLTSWFSTAKESLKKENFNQEKIA
jgi:hypothetical protein